MRYFTALYGQHPVFKFSFSSVQFGVLLQGSGIKNNCDNNEKNKNYVNTDITELDVGRDILIMERETIRANYYDFEMLHFRCFVIFVAMNLVN